MVDTFADLGSKTAAEVYNLDPTEFLWRFLSVDETWIHHCTPETKQQLKQCTTKNESAPKQAKKKKKNRTINAEYKTNILYQLHSKIKEKRPSLTNKKVLFHKDNAPVHEAGIVMEKFHELKFKILLHATNSPDMVPSDYKLFSKLREFLLGGKLCSDIEVISATNVYFEALEESSYREGIQAPPPLEQVCVFVRRLC
ncbi:Mariner Mos1 transposase like protein [Argiope bruennichi]|uniref:Mariner Mos1 transposase like protein n=1 Tax=Argiope bruennichi TaxID=94029 RepID=A0A8T0FJF8_ARGBR|nr:Mariner Mos1 transposase like protein [Argiope bruennichi]